MDSPKTPKSKREANDRWDNQNMITLGCKIKRDDAMLFKEYAAERHKTVNTLLKEYIYNCISEHYHTLDETK